jgi:hypothetical protein
MLERMARLLVLALTLCALACSGRHDPSPPGPAPSPAAEPPVGEPAEPPELAAEIVPEPAPLAIGWATIPGELDPVADARNREALAHHRAGRHERALAGFEQALEADPAYDWARYNRACALARLHRMAEAVAEVERLVLEDLPTFGPRWAQDEDLAAAHATPEGQRLDARLPEIRAAYRQAIAAGIPAMTYRPRKPLGDGQPRIPQQALRLGAYDPTARRFVPAVPRVQEALAGRLDRQAERALVLAGDLVMGEIWLVQARRVDVRIFDLADPGRTVLAVDDVDAKHPSTDEIRVAVEAALEGDGARVTLRELGYEPKGTLSLSVTTHGVELTRQHVPPSSPRLHVDANGAFVDVPPPTGMSIEGGRLRVHDREDPIELGPGHPASGHHHVERTPDGRWALVLTEVAGCRERAFIRHVLDRVDLTRGETARLSSAPTHAGAALGPDGSVYLDSDGRVVRFPPDSTTPVDDVLPGVRFVLPDYDRDCSI